MLEMRASHWAMTEQILYMVDPTFLWPIIQILNLKKQINKFGLNTNMHILGQNSHCLSISPTGKNLFGKIFLSKTMC